MPVLQDLYSEAPPVEDAVTRTARAAGTSINNIATAEGGEATAVGAEADTAVAGQADASRAGYSAATAEDATASQASADLVSGTSTATASNQGQDVSLIGSAIPEADAASYSATQGAVNPEDLSQEQLRRITSQSSPLMARARQEGILSAARRGLQNSSYAAQASMGAMVDRALPLAQQDAATYSRQNTLNQQFVNDAASFNANAENQMATLNAQLSLAAQQGDQDAYNIAQRQIADLQSDISKFNAAEENRIAQFNTQIGADLSMFNANEANAIATLNAQLGTDVSKMNAAERNRLNITNAELQTAVDQFNAEQESKISALNAQLGTDVSQFNAAQLNEAERLNAQIETAINEGNRDAENAARQRFAELHTQVSMSNADRAVAVDQFNAVQQNMMNTEVLAQNAALNKQFLAGEQAMDLATIQGMYSQIISTNETAASMFNSYFSSISQAMANKDIPPQRIAQYVNVQQTFLESGLRMMEGLNALDLGEWSLPGARSSGSGNTSTITPTPATGVADTGEITDEVTPAPTTGGTTGGVPTYGTPEWDQWIRDQPWMTGGFPSF